jgi:hypothetical protein
VAGRELYAAKLRAGGGLSTRGACSRCPNVEPKIKLFITRYRGS